MPAAKPSCVVLGGGGFMGTNLCRRLYRSGHRVRAFGRTCHFPDELSGIEWRQGDFLNAEALAAAIEDFDFVFHLVHGATPLAANLAMTADVQRNIIPSITLLDLCGTLGVKRVIFASSGGTVYGIPQEVPTRETAMTDPICAYGISKLAIEKYLTLYERLYSLDFRILRIANPFGPFQVAWKGQGFIAAAVARALAGEPMEIWGDGSVVRDFVYIDDVMDAFEVAITDTGDDRVFNIGTGIGRDLRDVVSAIERQLGTGLAITWAPGRAIDIPQSILSVERAATSLGWRPKTPFDVGLALTIEWIRDNQAAVRQRVQ